MDLPVYCHTAHLMKIDNGVKRKLSKERIRNWDWNITCNWVSPAAVREYLMTILNSNFEEWRIQNPDSDINDFPFSLNKMSNSGALFDLDKLNDVSKNVLAKIPAEEIYEFLLKWAKEYKKEIVNLLEEHKDS